MVLPTYNRAHLIGDALDSIAAQSYRPIEVLVVDDGSTDDTKETVGLWTGDNSKKVAVRYQYQDNCGGNVARNNGISAARGEFVAFLDSDDVWLPDKLQRQMDLICSHPRYGAIYCGLKETDIETGAILNIPKRRFARGDLLRQLLVRDVTAPTSTFLVRRSVFDRVGLFDTDLKARQDWDMWIRIGQAVEIGAVEDVLVELRHHSGPRTISDPNRELDAYRLILKKYRQLRRKYPFWVRLDALAAYHRRVGRVNFHHRKKRLLALLHYLFATLLWPFDPDSYAALIGWFLPKQLRQKLHTRWNEIFGKTFLSIRNH